jgi:DNA-binding IclR family transcriptional regulator
MNPDQELKSLKRGLRALIMLSAQRSMTISAAARRLGLPRTTAERIMATLESERLIHVATPMLFRTTRRIGWPLAIAVAQGEQMTVRVTTDSATSLGLHKRHAGSEIAMAASSSGIIHLAFLDATEREELIALLAGSRDPAQALARDRPALDGYLDAALRDGFSIGPNPGSERAVSVPLREGGRLKAVLLMMYIARAIPPSKLEGLFIPQLKALAREIEAMALDAE